jgi:ankyrin repeat protein
MATERDGMTLLHDAVQQCRFKTSRFLLEHGAAVNAKTDDKLTPLHMAAMNGDLVIISLLLKYGAAINEVDASGRTPTDRAEQWRHPEAAELLKSMGGFAARFSSAALIDPVTGE